MTITADYIVVGSGLTGATIARTLADAGREVIVIERRGHLGGNVFDYCHESGIRIHAYGPHYFRTESDYIWEFVNRFSGFYRYESCLMSFVDGQFEHWPVTAEYISRTLGTNWTPAFRGTPSNFEEASLAMMPREVYERFVKGYTEKQWGVPANTLSLSLAGRFDVRSNGDVRLKPNRYQGIPEQGYARFTQNLLAGIPGILNFDYLLNREAVRACKLLIFTGAIDDFLDNKFGRLSYRAQRRQHQYYPEAGLIQPVGQVNYPDPMSGPYVRILEWKHMMPPSYAENIRGTVLTHEVPFSPTETDMYEYPMPDARNQELYQRYRELSKSFPNVLFCGRLGEYRYYDMDQAIARGLEIGSTLLASKARAAAV